MTMHDKFRKLCSDNDGSEEDGDVIDSFLRKNQVSPKFLERELKDPNGHSYTRTCQVRVYKDGSSTEIVLLGPGESVILDNLESYLQKQDAEGKRRDEERAAVLALPPKIVLTDAEVRITFHGEYIRLPRDKARLLNDALTEALTA